MPGNRLAILPFSYLDGSFSVEGRLLADELFMELAKSDKVELLEREKLAQIVQEHKLNEQGLMDPATAVQRQGEWEYVLREEWGCCKA